MKMYRDKAISHHTVISEWLPRCFCHLPHD